MCHSEHYNKSLKLAKRAAMTTPQLSHVGNNNGRSGSNNLSFLVNVKFLNCGSIHPSSKRGLTKVLGITRMKVLHIVMRFKKRLPSGFMVTPRRLKDLLILGENAQQASSVFLDSRLMSCLQHIHQNLQNYQGSSKLQ